MMIAMVTVTSLWVLLEARLSQTWFPGSHVTITPMIGLTSV